MDREPCYDGEHKKGQCVPEGQGGESVKDQAANNCTTVGVRQQKKNWPI